MGGKQSRDKGLRGERKVVHAHRDFNLEAERIPLSGAAGGSFGGDLRTKYPREDTPWTLEVKIRGDGFAQIYNWLGQNDALVFGADRKPLLIALPLARFLECMGGALTPANDNQKQQKRDAA